MATKTERIAKKRGVCSGDACIRGHRIPVWVLVNFRRMGGSHEDILRAYPSLTQADLEAALEYASANGPEIDKAIHENERANAGPAG
jgi:uncharacterized protein (DUF433 family)